MLKRNRASKWAASAAGCLALLAISAATQAARSSPRPVSPSTKLPAHPTLPAPATTDLADVRAVSRAFKQVARQVRPGVVHIRVAGGEVADGRDEEAERLREQLKDMMPPEQLDRLLRRVPPGSASGIILDSDGHILTNNHVIEGRQSITVVLADQRELPAKVVGRDRKTDLAVIRIEAAGLQALPMGDSDRLDVGDWVLAVGSPFGLQQTVTHGIVSATGRSHVAGVDIDYQDFIQTDAAINPGNSGGPLVNLDGEVVGINTAIAVVGDTYNAGVAFAVPSNLAAKIARQLIAHGSVRRGWLGISFGEVRKDEQELFGLPTAAGVVVERVLPQSPAEEAGVQVEDVIVAVNGKAITSSDRLRTLIADIPPEQPARLRVVRDREERTVEVRLAAQPDDLRAAVLADATSSRPLPQLGMQVRTLRPGMVSGYADTDRGVLVMGFSGEGEPPDIRPRELIVGCDNRPVRSVYDLQQALSRATVGRPIKIEVQDQEGKRRTVSTGLVPPDVDRP